MEDSNILGSQKNCLVALAIDGSEKGKYIVRWALEKFVPESDVFFKLLHVRPKSIRVPTPMGNFIPIAEVREDIAAAFRKEMVWQANEKLLPYKTMCTRKKVPVEIVQLESDDIVQAIVGEVARGNISKLVIGTSSRRLFSLGKQLSSRISEKCPRFCTVYAISKGKLSSLRPADSDAAGGPRDDRTDLSFSTSTSSRRDYCSQSGRRDDDTISCASSREANGALSLNTKASSFSSLSAHDQVWTNDQLSAADSSSEFQVNVNYELEKLRIELKHLRGMCQMAQNDANDASRQLNDLNITLLEEKIKLRETALKEEEAKELAKEEKEKYEAAKTEADYLTACAEKEAAQKREAEAKALHEAKEKETLKHALEGLSLQYQKFTWEEIAMATSSFSEDLKVGMGAYGTVYKGSLHHTAAAVKVLHSKDGYGLKQFHQELEILSKIRHPHLLSLLGACPEHGCLVYEFMENGSLEDCLLKKRKSPPLPWFVRSRIAWEVASALVYLHNSKPKPIIHRDLKPANILLDHNLVSKIGDVGLSTMLQSDSSALMSYRNTGLVGTFCYIDPEYQRTGVISPKSDVYAFGVVMLQLLTAKPATGLAYLVEKAIENHSLSKILDQEAGGWPVEETKILASLALRCTELRSQDRPDLKDQVLPILEKVKEIADNAWDCTQIIEVPPPNHFICPILKEVMEDPCVAADGYTYDRKSILAWLEENDKSPMTNHTLAHKNLLPNYTLLSAITEWRSQNH